MILQVFFFDYFIFLKVQSWSYSHFLNAESSLVSLF